MRYADLDGDGYPDHVLGPDGTGHPFDPFTGQLTGGPPAPAASSGGNISSSSGPGSFGGGGGGSFAAPSGSYVSSAQFVPSTPPAAAFGSSSAPTPRYANNERHPYFGGSPLQPGGRFNTGSSGGYSGPPVYVPGGASVSSSGIRSAYPSDGGGYGGGSSSSSGGGGSVRSLISALRSKFMGNLYPGSSSGYSSSYGEYEPYKPEKPQMRGFAKGMSPEQAQGLYYRPSMLLPKIGGKALPASSPDYADIASLPMAQLVQLSGGRKLSAPKTDAYGNLTSKDRSLSDYTNSLASTYNKIVNREQWFDYDQMAGNLMHAGGNSALGAQFKNQPASMQASNFLANTGALFGATLDPKTATAWQGYANYLADKWGGRQLGKNPTHGGNLARWAGRKLLY